MPLSEPKKTPERPLTEIFKTKCTFEKSSLPGEFGLFLDVSGFVNLEYIQTDWYLYFMAGKKRLKTVKQSSEALGICILHRHVIRIV